ncbi:MAG: hypothetical protein D3914_09135 [Candidatus Electrothrix sp. LOE2]|jgi:hypothetical protein|nr:hypothetical protein [Candidatus Electrothrix sp. LOE2]
MINARRKKRADLFFNGTVSCSCQVPVKVPAPVTAAVTSASLKSGLPLLLILSEYIKKSDL